jgi:hypothetical protein
MTLPQHPDQFDGNAKALLVRRGQFLVTVLLLLEIPFVIGMVALRPGPFPNSWTWRTFLDLVTWGGLVALATWAARRLSRRWASALLLGAVLVQALVGVGFSEGLAAILFVASTYALGRLIVSRFVGAASGLLLASQSLAIGAALQLGLFGLFIHFPVNFRGTYLAVLALPIVLAVLDADRSRSWAAARVDSIARGVRRLAGIPLAQVAVFVGVIGYVARFSYFPSLGYDDMAFHLRMWSVLSASGSYTFEPVTSVMSVIPFALDLLTSVVSIVAGADARGAVNLTLLLLLLCQFWRLGAYTVRGRLDRGVLVVLFVSTPMLANLLTGQQVELFLALLATTGARLAIERSSRESTGRPAAVLAVAALCAASKLPGAVLGALLLAAYLVRAWTDSRELRRLRSALPGLFALLPTLAFSSMHSYLVAWKTTGNPFFPFYNAYFRSPFFPPINFADSRYATGSTPAGFWNIFFHTSAYSEASDYTAGFQYLLVLPIGLVHLASRRFRALRWPLLLPLLGFGLIMFGTVAYWRYLFPVLPLASVVMGIVLAGAIARAPPAHTMLRRGLFLIMAAINLYFLPGVNWFFIVPAYQYSTESGRSAVTARLAPEKSLTEEINRRFPRATVLYDSEIPAGATLVGKPIYTNWYSQSRHLRYWAWERVGDVAEFIRTEGVELVIWDLDETNLGGPRGLLLQYLSRFALPEFQIRSKVLYRIVDRPPAYRTAYRQSGAPFVASAQPRLVASVRIGSASAARYSVTTQCPGGPGYFIAQVNWDYGGSYNRRVACGKEPVEFSESIPIPLKARAGEVYVTVHDTPDALATDLHIETN